MFRLTITLAASAALAGTLAVTAAPAAAQAGQTTVVIFGNDPCPREAICIRAPESQRYRLPKEQQLQGTRQQRQSWAQKSQALTTVGQTGTGSCSAVGPGGRTGCLVKEINQARKDAREQNDQNVPPER
jgi:type II secretory pathway pseudopilin PulG